jgi:HTH-like domain
MVKYLEQSYRVSERHACCVLEVARATHRYDGHQEQWIELRMHIREIAPTRVRYGYRMIRVLLNGEGWQVGKDLVYRLYKEEGWGCASGHQENDALRCNGRSVCVLRDRTKPGPWTSFPINSATAGRFAR